MSELCIFDYSDLKGRIIAKFNSVSNFEKRISKSHTFVYNVFSGKTFLDVADIDEWASILEIPDTEIGFYFCKRNKQ